MADKLIVNLGDGTWVELSMLQTISVVPEEIAATLDEFPADCEKFDHIHLKDMYFNSHWDDTCEEVSHGRHIHNTGS